MANCKFCNKELIRTNVSLKCEECEKRFLECWNCKELISIDDLDWISEKQTPQNYKACSKCSSIIRGTEHVIKSDIYKHYNFAFKFQNRMSIPYPMYFRNKFPFGEIQEDWGDDFRCKETNAAGYMMGTDWGTSKAYKVILKLEDDNVECVALSHESGLEVFLIAVGAFIGMETSKFLLKRSLETIENKINNWWKKNKQNNWREDESDEPLVMAIQVRTPNWEIKMDGKFTKEEREKFFDLIQQQGKPKEKLDDFLELLPNPELSEKLKKASKEIVKRDN